MCRISFIGAFRTFVMQPLIIRTVYFVEFMQDNRLCRIPNEFHDSLSAEEFVKINKLSHPRILQVVQRTDIIESVVWPIGIENETI